MVSYDVSYSKKACAYITRNGSELLVFKGPDHEELQIPKGTVEDEETPQEAVYREVIEESGLAAFGQMRHLITDVWTRRRSPEKRYVRSFFHASAHETRDRWTHTVTGSGEESGMEFELFWVDLPTEETFALDLDDYVGALRFEGTDGTAVGTTCE